MLAATPPVNVEVEVFAPVTLMKPWNVEVPVVAPWIVVVAVVPTYSTFAPSAAVAKFELIVEVEVNAPVTLI